MDRVGSEVTFMSGERNIVQGGLLHGRNIVRCVEINRNRMVIEGKSKMKNLAC